MRKFASFENCGSYKCRMSPFFETVKEVEKYCKERGIGENCYIHPATNYEEIIAHRNSYNTDESVID